METFETVVPYIWSRHPPKQIDVVEMLKVATKQLNKWIKNMKPVFTQKDGLHLTQIKKQKDGLYLQYEIIRNKYKEEKGE